MQRTRLPNPEAETGFQGGSRERSGTGGPTPEPKEAVTSGRKSTSGILERPPSAGPKEWPGNSRGPQDTGDGKGTGTAPSGVLQVGRTPLLSFLPPTPQPHKRLGAQKRGRAPGRNGNQSPDEVSTSSVERQHNTETRFNLKKTQKPKHCLVPSMNWVSHPPHVKASLVWDVTCQSSCPRLHRGRGRAGQCLRP